MTPTNTTDEFLFVGETYSLRNPNYVAPVPIDYPALLKMAVEALEDIVTRSYDDGMSKVIDMRDIAQTTIDKIRKAGVK